MDSNLSHLEFLEAESIEIIREAVAGAKNPVMLFSIGKDSSVMLQLALKSFFPALPPLPLLHVDTTWKFKEMYEFRNQIALDTGMKLIVHTNKEGIKAGISPFTHGSNYYTDVMKTQALRQALEIGNYDVILGGARRDEEQSRSKERIFSFRSEGHNWDPKAQRAELWNLYNTKLLTGQTMRVFPLSNWTEKDIWQYLLQEKISIVPLYFAKERPVVCRNDTLIMVDDERIPLEAGETPQMKSIRFRTLGCYPLTGAIESNASTLEKIVLETMQARTSERQGRLIDSDETGSMEKKKREGYF
tara:strand:- start:1107 stop:2012 length:906 start_codon:yes stop_codon:yes gene_type:complete